MEAAPHIVGAMHTLLFGLTVLLVLSALRLTFLQRDFPLYWGPGCRHQHRILVRRHTKLVRIGACILAVLMGLVFCL